MKKINRRSSLKAVLAGAFAAAALSGCSGGSGGPSPTPQTTDFVIRVRSGDSGFQRFVVRLSKPEAIAKARDLIAHPPTNGDDPPHVYGTVARGSDGYNRDPVTGRQWHWHLVPNSVVFVEQSAEGYDGRPSDLEADVNHWVNVLKKFGPWASIVERELT